MGPERKFYEEVKKSIPQISWIRLENNSLHGTPDLLGYNNSGVFFTVELKVTKSNKVRFSPHQIAFHVRHPNNSFILVKCLGQRSVKLFQGSRITELAAWCLTPGVNAVDLYMPRSRRVNLGPGPVARLLGAVALVGLMAWSVSLASLPEMGLT